MPINPTWDPAEIRQKLVDWLRKPGNERITFREPQEEIEAYVSGRRVCRAGDLSVDLMQLSWWYSAKAAVELDAGDDTARAYLYQAFRYDLWRMLLQRAVFEAENKENRIPRLDFNDQGLLLAKAITLQAFQEADLVTDLALTGVTGGAFYGLTSTHLTPFVLSLFRQWKEADAGFVELPSPLCEVYEQLLQHWRTSELRLLAVTLTSACDFHTLRSGDHSDTDTFEFSWYVDRIYPVEILAVLRLRETLGLALPELDHPLTSSSLGALHQIGTHRPDPLLESLVVKLRNDYPTLITVARSL